MKCRLLFIESSGTRDTWFAGEVTLMLGCLVYALSSNYTCLLPVDVKLQSYMADHTDSVSILILRSVEPNIKLC